MNSNKFLHLLLVIFFLFSVKDVQAIPVTEYISEQQAPNPIKKIVKAIAKANVFVLHEPEHPSPLVTDLGKNYLLLSRLATSSELESLIRMHKNAVVRMYAFKALTTQVYDIPAEIMAIVNQDTTTIDCISRDVTEKTQINTLVQNFLN